MYVTESLNPGNLPPPTTGFHCQLANYCTQPVPQLQYPTESVPYEFHPKRMKITYLQPNIMITSGYFSSKNTFVGSPSVLVSRSKQAMH
jgi:hypothetical protein